MPFCPNCSYEYEKGKEVCPDCDVKLVAELPPEQVFVPVLVAEGEIEAEIVMGLLEEAGIPVLEKGGMEGETFKFSVGPLSEESIMVPESRLEDAQKIIGDAIEQGKQLPVDME